MLNSKPEQFRLAEDGQISWQENPTNPLPGEAIATLKRGEHVLKPDFDFIDCALVAAQDAKALREKVQEWLAGHIKSVLEDLVALENTDELSPEGKGIAYQLHEALGIMPREQVEDLIAGLDTETRRPVRQKKIKLGPILIFIYTLNKPAAVRMRALLWSLYNDRDLPAQVPNDGIVSMSVDPAAIDADYYRAIGYPVYGKRAIRVDMLDRLISAVYDGADKGKFSAKHEMAEWLGCSIEDLYLVLEAMGHKKIYDPAAQEQSEQSEKVATEESGAHVNETVEAAPLEAVEEPSETEVAEPIVAEGTVEKTEAVETPKAVEVKPELAVFRLKKGKANQKQSGGARGQKKSFKNNDKKPAKKGKAPKRDQGPRVISTGPERKLEDSPFAILGQLKK